MKHADTYGVREIKNKHGLPAGLYHIQTGTAGLRELHELLGFLNIDLLPSSQKPCLDDTV